MSRDLEYRILARVDDQRAAFEVLEAERLDRLDPVGWAVAQDPAPGSRDDQIYHLRRETLRIDGRGHGLDHSHQLPVARRGGLAGTERVQSAVQHGMFRGPDPLQLPDRAEPQPLQGREVETAEHPG